MSEDQAFYALLIGLIIEVIKVIFLVMVTHVKENGPSPRAIIRRLFRITQ